MTTDAGESRPETGRHHATDEAAVDDGPQWPGPSGEPGNAGEVARAVRVSAESRMLLVIESALESAFRGTHPVADLRAMVMAELQPLFTELRSLRLRVARGPRDRPALPVLDTTVLDDLPSPIFDELMAAWMGETGEVVGVGVDDHAGA